MRERSDIRALLSAVERLHSEVDARAETIATVHGPRLRCARGCSACCVDGLTVFGVEAERIRRAHPELLIRGTPHPPGACAMLADDGACRVYESRPYVCRTQGLPLRWLADGPEGETVEYRDICPLNDESGVPLEELEATDCWTIGPWESRLAELQSGFEGPQRIALRELFALPATVGPDRTPPPEK